MHTYGSHDRSCKSLYLCESVCRRRTYLGLVGEVGAKEEHRCSDNDHALHLHAHSAPQHVRHCRASPCRGLITMQDKLPVSGNL